MEGDDETDKVKIVLEFIGGPFPTIELFAWSVTVPGDCGDFGMPATVVAELLVFMVSVLVEGPPPLTGSLLDPKAVVDPTFEFTLSIPGLVPLPTADGSVLDTEEMLPGAVLFTPPPTLPRATPWSLPWLAAEAGDVPVEADVLSDKEFAESLPPGKRLTNYSQFLRWYL